MFRRKEWRLQNKDGTLNTQHKKIIGVPDEHTLQIIDRAFEHRHGKDIETLWYDEYDVTGQLVGKYMLKTSKVHFPPFLTDVCYERLK